MRICICKSCKRFIEVNQIEETWSVPDPDCALQYCWDNHRYNPYEFSMVLE
jgi:hypothetical protein